MNEKFSCRSATGTLEQETHACQECSQQERINERCWQVCCGCCETQTRTLFGPPSGGLPQIDHTLDRTLTELTERRSHPL
jgi:hypothetical protein